MKSTGTLIICDCKKCGSIVVFHYRSARKLCVMANASHECNPVLIERLLLQKPDQRVHAFCSTCGARHIAYGFGWHKKRLAYQLDERTPDPKPLAVRIRKHIEAIFNGIK